MRHIIVFCYIFTILLGVSVLTIQCLVGKDEKNSRKQMTGIFIVMLLIMNTYDFFVYYSDNIITGDKGSLLLSLGDCLIAALVFIWLNVEKGIIAHHASDLIIKISKYYIIIYGIIWIIGILFFVEYRWIRLIIDIPPICMLIVGGLYYVHKGVKKGKGKGTIIYCGVITLFLVINYLSYFIGESQVFGTITNNIMNITVFYWFVINAANLILTYKIEFLESRKNGQETTITLEDALEHTKVKCNLTTRECEILGELYLGQTNTQIADKLFISESTVKAHMYNIFKKLGVKNRIEAVSIIHKEREN